MGSGDFQSHSLGEDSLINHGRLFRLLARSSQEAIFIFTRDGLPRMISRSVERIFGHSPEEVALMGPSRLVHPEDRDAWRDALDAIAGRPGASRRWEYRCRHKDGRILHVIGVCANHLGDSEFDGILLTVRDNTENREREEEFRRRERWFQAITGSAGDAFLVLDRKGKPQLISPSVQGIFGYSPEELAQRLGPDLCHPDDRQLVEDAIDSLQSGAQEDVIVRYRARHASGAWLHLESVAVNRLDDEVVQGIIITTRDITDRALRDPLTGLPNRRLFLERLDESVERHRRDPDYDFVVLIVNLDRFKMVTDSFGHRAADQFLIEVASRLDLCVEVGDTIARLGGDEFGVLLSGRAAIERANPCCGKVHGVLAERIHIEGHDVVTSASIGLTVSNERDRDAQELLHNASAAMHQAKRDGSSSTEEFKTGMHRAVHERMVLEADLRGALERGEFEAWYQPIIDLRRGQLAGFEALVRWRHPERGLLGPGLFVPVAEETGLIAEMDRAVMVTACAQLSRWRRERPELDLMMSVNVSATEVAEQELVRAVTDVLQANGLRGDRLKLELTETALVQAPGPVAKILGAIHELGVQLALDDFGTGYSSLAHLHNFPIDILKVDRSFISGSPDVASSPEMLRSIIALADSLRMTVIAEGIETKEQQAQVELLGGAFGQGYHFARPMSAEDAGKFVWAPVR